MHAITSPQFQQRSKLRQRGDLLIESLIGMVLMAIIGMGVVFVTSKMSVSQKDMHLQEIAVNQLRALLVRNGNGSINLCAATKPKIKLVDIEVATEVQGCGVTTTATIHGKPIIVPRPLFISVDHPSLGGRVVVGGTWAE